MGAIERRLFEVDGLRIERAEEDNTLPKIVGHAAVFNSKTDLYFFTESIAPGAFERSIARGDDVRALFNHDANYVLGRSKAGTLQLEEDERGLLSTISPPDTQVAKDLITSIERGDISQMSFGFYVEKQEIENGNEEEKPHRTITQAALFDVSPVTFPAYEDTDVGLDRQLRALGSRDLAETWAEIEQHLNKETKTLGAYLHSLGLRLRVAKSR